MDAPMGNSTMNSWNNFAKTATLILGML
jgi:hypothetical protein